jgi:hypothetical protein
VAKSELTKQIEKAIYNNTIKMGVYGCLEVSIGWNCAERVDFMTYNTNGEFRCYEIKVSKADFRSNCKASFVGNYNYYVMPNELYEQVKGEIPKGIGVYAFDGRFVRCVKRPKRTELTIDALLLSGYLIRALSRETEKKMDSDNPYIIEQKNSEIRRLFDERNRYHREANELRRELSFIRRNK